MPPLAGPAFLAMNAWRLPPLEDLFGRPIDLVTEKALRPELRPSVEREARHV